MQWFNIDKPYFLSASLICGNPLDIAKEIKELEGAKIDALHFDVMDGHFVPRIGLYPEMLSAIKKITQTPIDVHLMLEEPEKYISTFAKAGADIITLHAESKGDLKDNVKMVKDNGARVGIALKLETDISILGPLLAEIDLIMLMAIKPGILGQKMMPETFGRIQSLSNKIKSHPNIVLEIDGGVTPETAPEMIRRGAHMLVCGTGTIYRPHEDILGSKVKALREIIEHEI